MDPVIEAVSHSFYTEIIHQENRGTGNKESMFSIIQQYTRTLGKKEWHSGKGGVQMLKTSFNAGWIYHDGGGGALDALIHGGQDNGKPVTLPHGKAQRQPGAERERERFFCGRELLLYQGIFGG